MLTKAIVDKVIDTNAIRVRIPVFNKASYNVNATPSEELYVATVCTLPNCEIPFQVGDVVIVGFEDNQASKPVIIGYLFRKTDYLCKADLKLSSLIVDGNVKFSNEISIGEINYNDILKLKGIKDNIQQQLDILTNRINLLMYGNSTDSGSADTPTVDTSPDNGEDAVDPPEDTTDTPTEDNFVELTDYEKYRKYVSEGELYEGVYTNGEFNNSPVYKQINPTKFHISTLWGEDNPERTHDGVDCLNSYGEGIDYKSLTAPAKSKVVFNGTQTDEYGNITGYGNYIILLHGREYATLYAHLENESLAMCSVGQILNKGDVFAKQGDAGNSSGEHLHLEVHKGYVSTSNLGTVLEPYAVLLGDWQLPDYEGD